VIAGLRIRELVVIGSAVTAGLAGTAVALGSRGADEQFLQNQRHPPSIRAAEVERVVRTAPDPQSGKGSGTAATCSSRGSGPLGNPWSCLVRYPSGKRYRLAVRVQQDGYYDGRFVAVKGAAATGCCIDLPGTR
jgi:hypothetical protein